MGVIIALSDALDSTNMLSSAVSCTLNLSGRVLVPAVEDTADGRDSMGSFASGEVSYRKTIVWVLRFSLPGVSDHLDLVHFEGQVMQIAKFLCKIRY